MHYTWWKTLAMFAVLSFGAFNAAACAQVGALAGQSAATAKTGAAACPTAANDTRLLTNEEHGYCLLYPATHTIERYSPSGTAIVVGSIVNHTDPRVSIEMEPAAGRTTQQAADAHAAEVGAPGMEVKRSSIKIGGQDAVVLDNVPYQDLARETIVAHNNRVYRLQFTPADPADAEVYAGTQKLYDTVVSSFRFTE